MMPSGANLLGLRTLAVERVDPAGQHRDRAAGVREYPFDVAIALERAAEQQARHRARGVVRHLDHRRERRTLSRPQQAATSGCT